MSLPVPAEISCFQQSGNQSYYGYYYHNFPVRSKVSEEHQSAWWAVGTTWCERAKGRRELGARCETVSLTKGMLSHRTTKCKSGRGPMEEVERAAMQCMEVVVGGCSVVWWGVAAARQFSVVTE